MGDLRGRGAPGWRRIPHLSMPRLGWCREGDLLGRDIPRRKTQGLRLPRIGLFKDGDSSVEKKRILVPVDHQFQVIFPKCYKKIISPTLVENEKIYSHNYAKSKFKNKVIDKEKCLI